MYISAQNKAFDLLKRKSIKYKLILIIMTCCIISVCLTTLAFMSSGIYQIKNQLKNDMLTLAQAVGDRNAAALMFEESDLINVDLSLLSATESIKTACIYNNKGNIFTTYSLDKTSQGYCPKEDDQKFSFTSDYLEIFHDISKKGNVIGKIFIRSDLKRVDRYVKDVLLTMLVIIVCIMLIAYALALQLQGMIHAPILSFMEDARLASTNGDYSTRVRKLYEDELGAIVDAFNNILEEREEKNKEFFRKSKELQVIAKKSEMALEYFNKEFKNPFHAASGFRALLHNQVFGPVSPQYIEYFNDFCKTDIEMYCLVNKVMELQKIKPALYGDDENPTTVKNIIENISHKYMDDEISSNINFTYKIQDVQSDSLLKHFMELFVDNMMSIFFNSVNEDDKYDINLEIMKNSLNEEKTIIVATSMAKRLSKQQYLNDNFNDFTLNKFTENIKNFNDHHEASDELIVDFNNMVIRGKVNVLNFLSTINNCRIIVSLSSNKICFRLTFLLEDALIDEGSKELA